MKNIFHDGASIFALAALLCELAGAHWYALNVLLPLSLASMLVCILQGRSR